MRDRLIELMEKASAEAGKHFRETTKKVLAEKGRFNSSKDIDRRNIYEIEADYLLENGVIVAPMPMAEQLDLLGNFETPTKPNPKMDNQKRNWENGFQRWSDKKGTSAPTEAYGKCGCGSMCEYCREVSYGRPCVRALNEMCRDRNINIDYSKRNYEDIWNGVF